MRKLLLSLTFLIYASVTSAYGPFDYTNPDHFTNKLPIVEQYHFDKDVENLRAGLNGTIMDDLAYVLHTFPNHHRALNAMSRLWLQYMQMGRRPPVNRKPITPEQYFQRAIEFAPTDGIVYLLNGIYLHKLGRFEQALELYKKALQYQNDNTELHYNIGLLYVDIHKYDEALKHAHIAYSKNYPLSGLRSRLKKAGKWKDIPLPKQSMHKQPLN